MHAYGDGRMIIVKNVSLEELKMMSEKMYEPIVKAVVDINRRIVVIDADLHSDEETFFLENGSKQEDLWGINLWPDKYDTNEFVEFDSMINLRPRQNNRSRGVENAETRTLILDIVSEVVT